MLFIHSAIGYVGLLACAWLCGQRHRRFPWKTVAVATALQFGLTGLLLRPSVREPLFALTSAGVQLLRTTSLSANRSLLFSGISSDRFVQDYGATFALEMAGILIFVAALSRILYYYRVLPWIVAQLGRFMQVTMGISSAESVAVAANILLGMTEAPLLIRPYVRRLTESELFCVMAGGMATIAGTVMVVYAVMLAPIVPDIAGHLLLASIISAPAAVAVAKVMVPETGRPETAERGVVIPRDESRNALDAAAQGAAEGMQLVINIVAMLVAFIGLVTLANEAVGMLGRWLLPGSSWDIQSLVGLLFQPLAWLMGVSWREAATIGELMGLKTVLNEFVAYADLVRRMQAQAPLSTRGFIVATYALCGFANVGSVAIMVGGIGSLAPERRPDLARLGLRSIVGGSLATMMTGCVVGVFL